MKIADIVKNSAKYTVASLAGTFISIPKNVLLGILVAPREFGLFSLLWLFYDYFSYFSPGFLGASTREMTYCLGEGKDEEALEAEKIGNFADLVYSLFITALFSVAAFFFTDTFLRIGLLLVAVWFLLHKLNIYYYNANYLRENYNITALSRFIIGGGGALATGILVWFVKGYALILGPVIAFLISIVVYVFKAKHKIGFKIDTKRSFLFLKTGFAISFSWFIINAFKLVDKTVISFSLSMHELGLFSFAALFVFFPHLAMQDFGNVLMPSLWKSWGDKNAKEFIYTSRRFAYFISVTSALIALFSSFFFYFVVLKLTPKYSSSIGFFNIFNFNIYFMAVIIMPNIMLTSKNINKAWLSFLIMGIGLLINMAGDYIAVKMGYGIIGIVIISVIVQAVMSLILYLKLLNYFAHSLFDKVMFIFKLYFPVFVNLVLIGFFHFYISKKLTFYEGLFLYASFSFGLWMIIVFVIYKDVIGFKSFKNMISKIKQGMP